MHPKLQGGNWSEAKGPSKVLSLNIIMTKGCPVRAGDLTTKHKGNTGQPLPLGNLPSLADKICKIKYNCKGTTVRIVSPAIYLGRSVRHLSRGRGELEIQVNIVPTFRTHSLTGCRGGRAAGGGS